MLTRRLNGVEQLERKDLFAGFVDDPGLSPEQPTPIEQCEYTQTVLDQYLVGDPPAGPGADFAGTVLTDM